MEISLAIDEPLESDQGDALKTVEVAINPQATLTDVVTMVEEAVDEAKIGYLKSFGAELPDKHSERVDSIHLGPGDVSASNLIQWIAVDMLMQY